MNEQDKTLLQILLAEHTIVQQSVWRLLGASERAVTFAIGIMVAALAYGLNGKIELLITFLPIIVLGAVLFWIDFFTEILSMAGYELFLEEAINEVVGHNIVVWELLVGKRRRSRWARFGLYLIIIGSVVFTGVESYATMQHRSRIFQSSVLAVIGILVLASIIMAVVMSRSYESSHAIAKSQWIAWRTTRAEEDLPRRDDGQSRFPSG